MKRETKGKAVAAVILAVGLFHDTSWQAFAEALQGSWRGLTQLLPVAVLCIACARGWNDPHVSAACLAVFLMGTTTAACSAGWFIVRWSDWRCTEAFQNATTILSCVLAVLALMGWKSHARQTTSAD